MTAEEYLSQINSIKVSMELAEQRARDLKIKAWTIKSIDYSRDRVMGGTAGSFAGDVEKYTETEKEFISMRDELKEKKDAITKQIMELENADFKNLLYKCYVELKPRRKIAQEMNYSESHISRLKRAALKEFERRYLGKNQ